MNADPQTAGAGSSAADSTEIHRVRAGVLDVAVERYGLAGGWPVVLLHGFPFDVQSYRAVGPLLADAGADVVVPYLRGYGPTRFADAATMRSGQQAALAHDLTELIEALKLDRPIVGGFDWGGRAACLVAALWPEQVSGLVTHGGYNVQHIASAQTPGRPEAEARAWYQYYLHGERGRAGLAAHRADFARLLWHQWAPKWQFSDAEFDASKTSFDNPDFVEVVVHSYRHRFGLVDGDPAYEPTEQLIAQQPVISVPTIILDTTEDPLKGPRPRAEHEQHFSELVDHRLVATGHNVPQEAPDAFATAVLDLHRR